jgi:hypothetical protein
MSRHTLYLEGWERESCWGWDPAQEVWYAQLWIDGSEPGGNGGRDRPLLWLTPPGYYIAERHDLAEYIAEFLGLDVDTVLEAFEHSYDGEWRTGGDDWEPEPPPIYAARSD